MRPAPDDERVIADVLTTEQRIIVVPESSPHAAARDEGVRVADVMDLPFFRVPPHTPRPFTEYLYFGDESPCRSTEFALTPQEVLTGVVAGRAAGSGRAAPTWCRVGDGRRRAGADAPTIRR
ncbi:hypothetical protein ACFW4X_19310 [Streptomyces smyrnaeus]|uniref:hypothetical protein n=1 Tax=Streptomyces smyrnaeus TaxID=1387713 RepID=UPI003686E72C